MRTLSAIILGLGAASTSVQTRPPGGTVTAYKVHSALYGADRDVWVYTPPGYDARKGGGYDLLVAFDGGEYRSNDYMGVPAILDSLLAAKAAPPFVAVMIDNGSGARRTGELGNSKRYARFLGEELMPWARGRFAVTRDPHHVIITGSSAGGLGAAFAALERPDLFGNVLSQSAALWRGAEGSNEAPYEALTSHVKASAKKDVRFLLDVGAAETLHTLRGAGPVFIEANRRFRDALRAKGYQVAYTEVTNGVHDYATWRPRFPIDLVSITAEWR